MQHHKSIRVNLWGRTVGYLAMPDRSVVVFEYEKAFKESGWEISPFELPLNTTGIYKSPETSSTFQNLPGIIADCLPDSYGKAVIEGFYQKEFGWLPASITALDYLAYIGNRSIGALEFEPTVASQAPQHEHLEIQRLVDAARKTLQGKAHDVLPDLLKISASAGGRQAKALVDFNPRTQELRSGLEEPRADFIPCIIKFDGIRDGDEPNFYGRLEYVYTRLAERCGIQVPRVWLLEDDLEYGPAAHFIIERYDRSLQKEKTVHCASLCGLLLRDFRQKHSCDYETYFGLVQQLTRDASQLEEAFRRAAFNIIFRNQDDHTKNFGFCMSPQGLWHLAPAFDLNYVYGQGMASTHQMRFSGKDDDFTREDFVQVSKKFGMHRRKISKILNDVQEAAQNFEKQAHTAGLDEDFARGIAHRFRHF
ncbi:MAG TPA: type II toxin-antitoxin system HipA family toxin [Oligoflexus sp.]|uniref:type II toxin-antitoxin system HipA family toxin n=1 Tax=Oligoflexus sp. TaxID=1971216 RepID=UPI002D806AD6|nr:type II toxin-antitoxin system HipA family toxin [Oligoflexus sp.]HET9239584.1 type II toxin-antitoxin system HipA family toxin [Oligoflexus sp.]